MIPHKFRIAYLHFLVQSTSTELFRFQFGVTMNKQTSMPAIFVPTLTRKISAAAVVAIITAVSVVSTPALAYGNDPISASVHASAASVAGSIAVTASIAAAPLLAFAAGREVVLSAIEFVGETAVLTLRVAGTAATQVVRMSANVVRGIGVTVGNTVAIVAHGAGAFLMVGATTLAFVPNASTATLLHSSRSS
jgi:hypothetical protein